MSFISFLVFCFQLADNKALSSAHSEELYQTIGLFSLIINYAEIVLYFLFVQCWTQLVERKYDPTGRKGRKGTFPWLRCGGWRVKEQWGRSSLLWMCCPEWVTAVCTWGGQKGKAEQIRGWLLVNVQVEKKHVNGWMFPKLSLVPTVAEIGPLWATQSSPYSPPNESNAWQEVLKAY